MPYLKSKLSVIPINDLKKQGILNTLVGGEGGVPGNAYLTREEIEALEEVKQNKISMNRIEFKDFIRSYQKEGVKMTVMQQPLFEERGGFEGVERRSQTINGFTVSNGVVSQKARAAKEGRRAKQEEAAKVVAREYMKLAPSGVRGKISTSERGLVWDSEDEDECFDDPGFFHGGIHFDEDYEGVTASGRALICFY